MSMNINPVSSPHAHDHSSVRRIMGHVSLALLPCTAFGVYLFGLPALNLLIITIASAILCEMLMLKLMGQQVSQVLDGSALLTGLLLAISLPPWAPWWIGVAGSVIAISIGKQLYGGLGQNVFNPAMLARVALLISFPVHLTTWPTPEGSLFATSFSESLAITFGYLPIPDGMTGATALGHLKTELSSNGSAAEIIQQSMKTSDALLGFSSGSLGETSALLVLLGGCWLLAMRVISWHIPLSMIGTVALLSWIFNWIDPEQYAGVGFHLFTGSLLLGAFFIATDYVTSPASKKGQLVFGAGCGVLSYVIRTWGGYPEGISFAVLFMNALTPLIDIWFRPRIYGRRLDGKPRTYSQPAPETIAADAALQKVESHKS
jgi:electron transport complex protein RnfD